MKPPGPPSPHSQTAISHGRVLVKIPPKVMTIQRGNPGFSWSLTEQLTEGYCGILCPLVTRKNVVIPPHQPVHGDFSPVSPSSTHFWCCPLKTAIDPSALSVPTLSPMCSRCRTLFYLQVGPSTINWDSSPALFFVTFWGWFSDHKKHQVQRCVGDRRHCGATVGNRREKRVNMLEWLGGYYNSYGWRHGEGKWDFHALCMCHALQDHHEFAY